MPGVRIHHREKHDCIVQIPRPAQLAGNPAVAPNNIRLDINGDAIVSEGVLAELREAFRLLAMPSVFLILDEVKEPPTLIVGGAPGRPKRVYRMTDGELREQPPQREALHVGR